MQAKQSFASPSTPSQTSFSAPAPAMIWLASGVLNNTKVNGTQSPGVKASNYTNSWRTWADVFGWSWNLFSMTVAFGMIGGAFSDPTGVVASVVAFVLAVVAIILSFVALTNHSWWLPLIVCGVAVISAVLDGYSLKQPAGRQPGWLVLNVMSLIGDSAAAAITIVEYWGES
jgi:hypothetical protein